MAFVVPEAAIGGLHREVETLLAPTSVGFSKSGAADKCQRAAGRVDRKPGRVAAGHQRVQSCLPSASVAVTVVTAVLFSATLKAAPEVITGAVFPGASLTSVTVTAMACVVADAAT